MSAVNVAAIMLVRDEADILGPVLNHLHEQGIHQILAWDNMSEDHTREILDLYGCHTILDEDPGHDHATKATTQAHQAHDLFGVDWILPVDADEVFYVPDITLAEFFAGCDADIVEAHGWDHIVTDDDDYAEPDPLKRITRRRQRPQRLPKVAYRWHPQLVGHMGNHDVTRPGTRVDGLWYRHFQYRSFEQMLRKVQQGAKAVETANLAPTYCEHWRKNAALSTDDLFRKWRRLCEEPGLIEDPCPSR